MTKIISSFCFRNTALKAAEFYIATFKSGKIIRTAYYGQETAMATGLSPGEVLSVDFETLGHSFNAINGPDFTFSPSLSFFIYCDTEEEIKTLWDKLSSGGSVLMGLDTYPWSPKYGWCADKYGVSWQLMLASHAQKIVPSFLFVNKLFGKGEEAMKFYTALFPNSKVENIHHDPETNTVMHGNFSLSGQTFALMEGKGEHPHAMTPAISFVINCKDQKEIDYYWEKLSEGGKPIQCGWVEDKFGVSWQVVPESLSGMVCCGDQRKTDNVMQAVMTMTKLDAEELKRAFFK